MNDHEGTIYYQVIHERTPRQLATSYHIFPAEWNEKRSAIATPITGDRSAYLYSIKERIYWDVERLTKIIRRFESGCLPFNSFLTFNNGEDIMLDCITS